jgi:hypothetical protein
VPRATHRPEAVGAPLLPTPPLQLAPAGRAPARAAAGSARRGAPPQVLPETLNRILIIVVVLSMALTPALAEFGKRLAERSEELPLPGGADGSGAPASGSCQAARARPGGACAA